MRVNVGRSVVWVAGMVIVLARLGDVAVAQASACTQAQLIGLLPGFDTACQQKVKRGRERIEYIYTHIHICPWVVGCLYGLHMHAHALVIVIHYVCEVARLQLIGLWCPLL